MEEKFGFFKIRLEQGDGQTKKVIELYFPAKEDTYRRYESLDSNIPASANPKYMIARFEGDPSEPKLKTNSRGKLSLISEEKFNEEFEKYNRSLDSDIDIVLPEANKPSESDREMLNRLFKDYGLEEK
jgi:hypothetical protein